MPAIGLFVSSRTAQRIGRVDHHRRRRRAALSHRGQHRHRVHRRNGGQHSPQHRSPAAAFESIERGVVDLRDLVYYLSLTVLFLALNVSRLTANAGARDATPRLYRRNATS